jgi:hypothetical protein
VTKLIVAFRNFAKAPKNTLHSTEPHDTNKLPQYVSLTPKDDFYNYVTQYCQSQWLHDLQHKLLLTTRPLVPRNNRLLNRQQNTDHANIIITITTIIIHTPSSSIIFCLFRATNKKSSSTSHNLLFLNSCQLFPLFLMSSYSWLNYIVLGCPICIFP